jgi:hypothetical protein
MNYREEIKKLTKSVPKSVTEGGVMQAGLWKQKAVDGLRVAGNSRASTAELINALEALRRFE